MITDIIIEEMGRLFEKFGVNPIMGRIFGLLFTTREPKSLIEISQKLSLSKAAISIQIRILEEMEYCVKLPKTKDRQHYYALRDDYLERAYLKRIEKEKEYIRLIEKILATENNPSSLIKNRLKKFISFQQLLVEKQQDGIISWQMEKDKDNDI